MRIIIFVYICYMLSLAITITRFVDHVVTNHDCYMLLCFISSMANPIVNHPKNHQKYAVETKAIIGCITL